MINLYDILEAADGQLFGDPAAILFPDFCFDSRRVQPGQLFVALKTERGDGHHYMQDAVQGGATGIMCSRPPDFDTTGLSVVVMRNVDTALLKWAQIVLRKYGTTVVGIAGSSGKSTAKEAIATVLRTRYRVFSSPANYDGKFGLPIALGKLSPNDKLAVLEFGSDQFGEMAELVEASKPLVGVITGISEHYTGRLGNAANVAAENRVLVERLPENGLAILNYNDDQVRDMAAHTRAQVLTIGLDRTGGTFGADLLAYNLVAGRDKTGFDLLHERERYIGKWWPLLGIHHLYGLLAALAVGAAYDIPIRDGLRALSDMQSLPGRLNPLEGKGGCLLVDDSISASYDSIMAALDWLDAVRLPERNGRLIFIMGDMDNPGPETMTWQREVGQRAAQVADVFVTEGDQASVAGRAALDYGMDRSRVQMTFSPQDAVNVIAESLDPNDVVLVKGSLVGHMEHVTQLLLANEADAIRLPRAQSAYDSTRANRSARSTWIEVDKTAIAYNVRRIKEIIGPDVELMAVVKANGYGHGAIATGSTALLNGASYLGVASIAEAVELRDAAIDAPILILTYTPPWAAAEVIRYNLTIGLYDLEMARLFDRAAHEMNATINVHVKIDTGMGRLGLLPDQVMPFFRSVRNLRNLNIEGIFTHFSSADNNPKYSQEQLRVFNELINPIKAAGFPIRYVHAANTAAALHMPEARFNMVRCGIGLYGLDPGIDAPLPGDFLPALSWKTVIAQVKTLPPGSYVGYGNTYQTQGEEQIALLPVGYSDGLRRAPKNWGEVLVSGQRVPLIGRVSMNLTAINVTSVPGVRIGDEVVLIGRQGDQYITADDVAKHLGTINYEVVTTVLARVPRV